MDALLKALNECYRHELTMILRYLNYSMHVTGLDRLHLTEFFRESAQDSMGHATKLGEKIVALGGTAQGKVTEDLGVVPHGTERMLQQALKDEESALSGYSEAIPLAKGDLALREVLVHILKEEQAHADELKLLLKK
ncbi:MAG: ferritin-like domain-containing protein [Acidobacteria bacterium]|nr:ferritin-like domain-containing protein [Acidobacteriota bacterium]